MGLGGLGITCQNNTFLHQNQHRLKGPDPTASYYAYPCGSMNFVPDDPIDVIAAFDPQGDLCGHAAVLYVEQEFECVVPDSALSNCTFGEFVAAVIKARNKGKDQP